MKKLISIKSKKNVLMEDRRDYYYSETDLSDIDIENYKSNEDWGTLTKYEINFLKMLRRVLSIDTIIKMNEKNVNTNNEIEIIDSKEFKYDYWFHKNKTDYKYKINWELISENFHKFPRKDITYYEDKLNWSVIDLNNNENSITDSKKFQYDDKKIKEFKNKELNRVLSKNIDLMSYHEIRNKKEKIDWNLVSKCGNLTLDFMIKFKTEINWEIVSEYQIIVEFLIRYKNKSYCHSPYKHIGDPKQKEIKDIIENYIDWNIISRTRKMNLEMVRKFQNELNFEIIRNHERVNDFFEVD